MKPDGYVSFYLADETEKFYIFRGRNIQSLPVEIAFFNLNGVTYNYEKKIILSGSNSNSKNEWENIFVAKENVQIDVDTKIDSGHFGFRVLGTLALNQKPFKHAAVKFEPLISSDVSKDPNLLNIPDFIIKNDELVFTIPEGVWKIKKVWFYQKIHHSK